MATEANIPVGLKKGEGEEYAFTSESFEDKVPELLANKVKQLETSSQVAETVNTPLETGKLVDESGSFFQTLSVPMVTADQQSKTSEDKSVEAQEASQGSEDGSKDIEKQKSEESVKKLEQDEEAEEIKSGIEMEETAKHEEKIEGNSSAKVENESSSMDLNDKAIATLNGDENEETVNLLGKDQDKAEFGGFEITDSVAPSQHEAPIVLEKEQGNSDGVTNSQEAEAPCVDVKETTTVEHVSSAIDSKEQDLDEKLGKFLEVESVEKSPDAQEATKEREYGETKGKEQKSEESVEKSEKVEETEIGISTETKSQVEKTGQEEEDTLVDDGQKEKQDEEAGSEKVEYEKEAEYSTIAVVNKYEDAEDLQEKKQYNEDEEHEVHEAKERTEELTDVKETTTDQHVSSVTDFKERDVNEMSREFLQEETKEKPLDAQEESVKEIEKEEETDVGISSETKSPLEKTGQEEDTQIDDGQKGKPDKEVYEETGPVKVEHEEEVKHPAVAVVNTYEDKDNDDVTNARDVSFEDLQEKKHYNEDEEDAVGKSKENVEQHDDKSDEKAIEKEVGEENVPENAESEEGLLSDSVAPSQKETLDVLKDLGDNDGVTSSQEAPCVDKETTNVQHTSTVSDLKLQDLNEKPGEFLQEETEEKSLDAQEASKDCEDGEKKEIEQKPEESIQITEKEEETDVGVSTETKTQVEKTEHEEEDTQIDDGHKETPDTEVREETGSEKVEYEKEAKHSAIEVINKDENEGEEKEKDTNVLEKDEVDDNVTSSQDVTLEKDVQEKNHHTEEDENEVVTAEEVIEKDSEDIISGEETERQTPINSIPTDVCISTQTEPEEETTEKKDEEAIEIDDDQTKKSVTPVETHENVSEKVEPEEVLEHNLEASIAQSEDETMRKDHEKEHELYVSEKGQSDGDDLKEGESFSAVPKEILIEEAKDKSAGELESPMVELVREAKTSEMIESEEGAKHSDSYSTTLNETETSSKEEKLEKEHEPERSEVQGGGDEVTSSQNASHGDIKEITVNQDAEDKLTDVKEVAEQLEDEEKEPEESVNKPISSFSVIADGNADEDEVYTGNKEAKLDAENQAGRTQNRTEITDESVSTEMKSLELGQLHEQDVEETNPYPSETVIENPEDEIKKEEKSTVEHEPVEVSGGLEEVSEEKVTDLKETPEVEPQKDITSSGSLEASTEAPSSSEKEKTETVSEVPIPELVPELEASMLKKEFVTSETETQLDEEKETATKEISSDEKTVEPTEIKEEAEVACEDTSSEKTELEEGLKLFDSSDKKIDEKDITAIKGEDKENDHKAGVSAESITSSQNEVSEEKEDLHEKNYQNEGNEDNFIKSREGVNEDTPEIKSGVETKENTEETIATTVSSRTYIEPNKETVEYEEKNDQKVSENDENEIVKNEENLEDKIEDAKETKTGVPATTVTKDEEGDESAVTQEVAEPLKHEEKEKEPEESVNKPINSFSVIADGNADEDDVDTGNKEAKLDAENQAGRAQDRTEITDESASTEKMSLERGQPHEQNVEETKPIPSATVSENPEDEIKKEDKDLSPESVNDTNDNVTNEEKSIVEHEPVEVRGGLEEVSEEKVTDLKETPEVEPQEDITSSGLFDTSTKGPSISEIENAKTVFEVPIPELVPKLEDSTLKKEFVISETETQLEEKETATKEISSDEKAEETTEIKNEAAKVACEDTSSEKTELKEGLKLFDSSDMKINEKDTTAFKDEDQETDHNVPAESQSEDNITSLQNEVSEEKEDLQEKNYNNEGNEDSFIKSREGVDEDTPEIKFGLETKENTEEVIATNVSSTTYIEPNKETVEYDEKKVQKVSENNENEIVNKEENLEDKQEDANETKTGEPDTTVTIDEEGDDSVVTQEARELHEDETNIKSEQSPEEDVKETKKYSSKVEQEEETKEEEQQGVMHADSTTVQTESQEEGTQNAENESEEGIQLSDAVSDVNLNEKAITFPSNDEDQETITGESIKEDHEVMKTGIETEEIKEQHGVTNDALLSVQIEAREGITEIEKQNEDSRERDDDHTEKPVAPSIKEICETTSSEKAGTEEGLELTDSSSVKVNESAVTTFKDEDQEKDKDKEVNTSTKGQGEDNVNSSQDAAFEEEDLQEKNSSNEDNELVITNRERVAEDAYDIKSSDETEEKSEKQESLHVVTTDVSSSAQKEPEEEIIHGEEKNEEATENDGGRMNVENQEKELEVKIAEIQGVADDVRTNVSNEETSEEKIDQHAMGYFEDKEITGEEVEDKSIYAQEANEQCENKAEDKVEQQPKESVDEPVNSSSKTIEGSVKEEADAGNNEEKESKAEAVNQIDKTEDRSELSMDLVQPKELNFEEIEASPTETISETTEDTITKDEDLSHDGIEHVDENITKEEKCLPGGITKENAFPTLEHEPVEEQKELPVLDETTNKPQEDLAPSNESLPVEDLESVSKVHFTDVLPRSEDSEMKEDGLHSTTEAYADKENLTVTKEISSEENLETHGSAEQPENSSSTAEENVTQFEQVREINSLDENRDIKEDVAQENQVKSTEDDKEIVKDVVLTKEVKQVPVEIEGEKGINDFKEDTVEENSYSPELEEKSAQYQKEMVQELSYTDSMPVRNPEVTEVTVNAQIEKEYSQGKEPKEERISSVEDVETVQSQVDLSNTESTVCPTESEKLTVQAPESDYDVQIPEVVADSEDSEVKNPKTDGSSSAPDKEQEYVKKASTESDDAKSSDLIIEEKALTKENLEVHEELQLTSEPVIKDQINTEKKPQSEQSDITSENIINEQASESKLEHTSIKELEDQNETTKNIILSDEVVVETEGKEKVSEEKNSPVELDNISISNQKELENEEEHSKPIPVGNTEVKAEDPTEQENIHTAEVKEANSEAINNTFEKKLVPMVLPPEELASLTDEEKKNEAVLETDKKIAEKSSQSSTDEILQIKRSSSRSDEPLETKDSVKDAEEPKLTVKDETITVTKGADEESEIVASEFKRVENTVTEENIITVDTDKEKATADEPQAESLIPEAANLEAIKASGQPQSSNTVLIDQKGKSESNVLHEPAKGNSEVVGNIIGERDLVLAEETGESGVKTDEEDEDEDNEDDEKMGSDAPVMVEASKDMEVKPHKKSHNILSGVGSKVKHSIAKVKKAITGKSSPPKSPSAKEKNQVIG